MLSRPQLIVLGFSDAAIKHRVAAGRLHPQHDGVYSVGSPDLTQKGKWMAAVLACGPGAVLSHESAAALWGVAKNPAKAISLSVPMERNPRHPRLEIHRRRNLRPPDLDTRDGIPVTSIATTLADLAARHGTDYMEEAVNAADREDLIDPEALRAELDAMPARRPGVARLKRIVDKHTFTMSDSELERRFRPIATRVGLEVGPDNAQQWVNGLRVDFWFPEIGLVVETDGLRYHRTAAQQAKDLVRDQTHRVAGLTPLRFSRWQVRFDQAWVEKVLLQAVHSIENGSTGEGPCRPTRCDPEPPGPLSRRRGCPPPQCC